MKKSKKRFDKSFGIVVNIIKIMKTKLCKYCDSPKIDNEGRQLCMNCYQHLRYQNRLDEYPKANLYIKKLKERYGDRIVLEFELCMYNLNHSLTKVGQKYGFCRERARQIFNDLFGNESYATSRDWLRLLAKQEKRNIQFNPMHKAERAKGGGFVRMGWQTEALIYTKLLGFGLNVSYPLKRASYDLIINNLKIEVKTGMLYKNKPTGIEYYRAVLSKLEFAAADFAIVYLPIIKNFYIIPLYALKGRQILIRITPKRGNVNEKTLNYKVYKNAWHLLGVKS